MMTLLACSLVAVLQDPAASSARTALASAAAATSTADDPIVSDVALLRFAEGEAGARLYLGDGGWQALLGDADGDLVFDLPDGVDALAAIGQDPAQPASVLDLWFSTDGDGPTWNDGDVLRIGVGGAVMVVHTEDEFRTALGTTSALDLDALERDASGRIWFSLRDGVASSAFGALEDGDVLVYDPTSGQAWRHATESEVQAWVDFAAPGLGAIGDLKSLAFDPATSDLLFTIQSPTAEDASVFSTAGGGSRLSGFDEASWAFTTSTELDALTFPRGALPEPPQLAADRTIAGQGENFTLQVQRASPNALLYGLAGLRRPAPALTRGGFQVAALDPSGPVRRWGSVSIPWTADAQGRASITLAAPTLPATWVTAEIVYQIQDGGGRGLSTPCILRVQ